MQAFDRFAGQAPIDLLAFIGQWPARLQSYAAAEELLVMADAWCMTGLCVSHMASIFGHDTHAGNEALFKETAKDARLLPFPILNPLEGYWQDELNWVIQCGAIGVRLVPGYHRFDLLDQSVKEWMAAVKEAKLPLQICARLEDDRLQHPFLQAIPVPLHKLAAVLVKLQGHPVMVSGLRDKEWENTMQLLPSGVDRRMMFCDLWYGNGPIAMLSSLCARGEDASFAYSSCTPIQTAEATAYQLDQAAISEKERYAFSRGNALRFLEGRL